jgi:ATP/maltotriose-dependent transcriptional regulator MalT
MIMNPILVIQNQLLATKFYVPTSPGTLIRRPRLSTLLDESLKYPLTLISAPAGFGKTTLLSTWTQALPATQAQVAWLSLDEEENDPQLFWTYILFRQWMEQLPVEVMACRPDFCLACVHLLWTITPQARLFRWLDLAEAALRASLTEPMLAEDQLSAPEQRDQLGKVLTLRTLLHSYEEDVEAALVLSEQALAHLSPENIAFQQESKKGRRSSKTIRHKRCDV